MRLTRILASNKNLRHKLLNIAEEHTRLAAAYGRSKSRQEREDILDRIDELRRERNELLRNREGGESRE